MAKLGTEKKPVVLRVQTQQRAAEMASICDDHGWRYIIGVEPDKPENVSHVERLLNKPLPVESKPKVGRNDPCSCGSGKKYKKCCGT